MTGFNSIGLKSRAIAASIMLLLAAVGALSAALISKYHEEAVRSATDHAVVYARSIGRAAEPSLLLNDRAALQRIATAGGSPAVEATWLVNAQGRIVGADVRRADFVAELGLALKNPLGRQVPTRDAVRVERSAHQLLIVTPIFSEEPQLDLGVIAPAANQATEELVGYVWMVHSLAAIDNALRGSIMSSALITVVVLVFGVVVTFILMRQLLTPVHDLVQTTAQIAAGDLGRRAAEDAVGEIGELARSFNDMADRLQRSHESIERTVAERTAELVRVSRAKDDFLANMSHEIRTPITAIVGFLEIMEEGCAHSCVYGRSQASDHLQTVRRNADHLMHVINDILDLSKIESGKLVTERIACDPAQVVREVRDLLLGRAVAAGLYLTLAGRGSLPAVIHTDTVRLRQILLNLVDNAIKFTTQGGVTITVGLDDAQPPAVPRLLIEVADTGIGIPEEKCESIFRPFTQADETVTRNFGGTGLGLTISRQLARVLDGDLTVQSTPGGGSTFRLCVATGPLEGVAFQDTMDALVGDAAEEKDAAIPVGQPAARKPDGASLCGCRILLAEDGPDNQRLIRLVVERAGAEVCLAVNGEVAVEEALTHLAAGTPYDVVLMDMQMPVLDGYSATRVLRERGYAGPIIALTAHAMSGDRDKCLAAGCSEYTTKPIQREALVRLIREEWSRSPMPQSAH